LSVLPILRLGNPDLWKTSIDVTRDELEEVVPLVEHLRDTLNAFRAVHRTGLSIASPQIGTFRRVAYIQVTSPIVLVNPVLEPISDETIETWENCLSFPELYVKTTRYKTCSLTYRDLAWREVKVSLTGDMSVLVQHECDHLDGILSVSRAVDKRSFCLLSEKRFIRRPRMPLD
jgi:peptide deformylase